MKNEILSTVLNRINNFNRVHFSLGYLVKLDRLNEKKWILSANTIVPI